MDKNVGKQRRLRKELNSIEFSGLKGIKIGDALAIDIWNCFDWTKEDISNFEFAEMSDYECTTCGKNADTVFLFSYVHLKRKDQVRKFNAFEQLFQKKIVIRAQKSVMKTNPYLSMIPIWYAQMARLKCSSIIKRGLCYKLCEAAGHAKCLMSLIEKHGNVRKLVVFFDVRGVDSILVQLCNQRNISTYTLQHGITNGTFDYTEYKCSHARYMLVWGEYTKRIAIHYGKPEERIRVVGNINQLLKKVELSEGNEKEKRFLICTNGITNKESWLRNQELIQMANQVARLYDMTYILKVHPFDNKERYNRIADSKYCEQICDKKKDITELLGKVRFALSGNSTTFCDSLYWRVPAFRYITERELGIDVCKGISWGRFQNEEELREMLKCYWEDREYFSRFENVRRVLFALGNEEEMYRNAVLNK